MYKINVKVESNKVSIISETIPITTNSLNTIKCIFDLPQEYEGLSCVAVFTCIDKVYKQMIVDNECIIPKDVLNFGGYVKIGVYAFKGEDLIYSPEPTEFKVVIGSYTEEESDEETEKTQTAFDKMIEKTNELFLKIEQSNEDLNNKVSEINHKLENGDFNGQNGKDGRDGQDGADGKNGTNGKDGFSPTITEKVNSDEEYILEITNKEGTFETPNLKGKYDSNETDSKIPEYIKNITEDDIKNWNDKSDFDGNYESLENKPIIPTKTSDLTNDSDFITQEEIGNAKIYHADKNTINDNIDLLQEIVNEVLNGKPSYIVSSNTYGADLFYINNIQPNTTNIFNGFRVPIFGENNTYSYTNFNTNQLKITTDTENTVTDVSIETVSGTNYNFLDTNKDYKSPYIPRFDGSPATKKYVDDSIVNSLANISGLTPQIVNVLPDVEEASSNIIYLVSDEEATENDLYNEYLFIDGRYEPIGKTSVAGADLSKYAKKDEVPLVYFWNGSNSTTDPNNIQLFQEIVNKHLEGRDILVCSNISTVTGTRIYYLSKDKLSTSNNTSLSIESNIFINTTLGANSSVMILQRQYHRILITLNDNIVTKVESTTNLSTLTNILSSSCTSDTNYYVPEHLAQPVSKGYLNEVVGDIGSILDYINGEVVGEETILLKNEIPVEENIEEDIEEEEVIEDGDK